MDKVFGLLLVVAIAIGIVPYARSLGTPEPPRGIAADHWVPMVAGAHSPCRARLRVFDCPGGK
jgi:hypothetical protein